MVSDADIVELRALIAHHHAIQTDRLHKVERDLADAEALIQVLCSEQKRQNDYGREY